MCKSSKQKILYNISYNNKNVIITLLWHKENPGIVRAVYSGIFWHTEGDTAKFSHIQACGARDIWNYE